MKLNSIFLKNFRNYSETRFNLDPRINIFLGNNGQGKTNLLEGIWILINGKTFRNSKLDDLIKFNQKFLEISGEFSDEFQTNYIKFSIVDNKKRLEPNSKQINSKKN